MKRRNSSGPSTAPVPIAARSPPKPAGPSPSQRPARTTSRPEVAPAESDARACTTTSLRSRGSARTTLTPPSTPARPMAPGSAGRRPARNPTSSSAETQNVAAFSANASGAPQATTTSPATGARTIWATTAAVHMALLAETTSSSPTTSGSSEPAAGLNATDPTDNPNATAYAATTEPDARTSAPATSARSASAPTIRFRRGSRSVAHPARVPRSSTGTTSNMTIPATPMPDPVSSNTSTTSATVLNASPARDTVWARNSRRNSGTDRRRWSTAPVSPEPPVAPSRVPALRRTRVVRVVRRGARTGPSSRVG